MILKKVTLALMIVSLTSCVGLSTNLIKAPNGKVIKIEQAYSIGIFTPTIQLSRFSNCDAKEVVHSSVGGEGSWTETVAVNCVPVVLSDNTISKDTSTPLAQSLIGAAGNVGAGVFIGEGLKDSNNSVNSNASSSTTINQNCRGNCGGKR